MLEVNTVRGDDHPTGRHLVTDLLRSEMVFTFCDPTCFRRDRPEPGVFQLSDRLEAFGCDAANPGITGSTMT